MSPRGTSRVDYLLHDQTRHGSRKHYLQNTIPVNEASVAPNPGICDHLAFNNATLLPSPKLDFLIKDGIDEKAKGSGGV